MECKFCGRELEDGAVYCFYCGKRSDGKKPCPSCGALLPEDAVFCGKCGKRVIPEAAEDKDNGSGDGGEKPEEENAEDGAEAQDGKSGLEDGGESWEVIPVGEENISAPTEILPHGANWKKALEITKLCLAGLSALVGFVFTFCIGVALSGAGGRANLSIFDYFGKVYENLDSVIVINELGDAQSFALYAPYLSGTLIAVAALVCNLVFTVITVISAVRQYAYKNEKADFIKPALRTFLSYAVFAAAFLALNASSSHTLAGANSRVYFNDVTLSALIIGGVAFGGYFACRVVLRLADFTDKKEIVVSSVALGTGAIGIIVATLLTLTVCRFATATENHSLGFMAMIAESATLADGANCSGVMCFGIPAFAVQTAMLILTVCVLVSVCIRVGSGSGKKPLAFAISAAALSILYFLGAFAAANMLNAEIVPENSVSRSYAVPVSVMVLSFIMLGGVIAAIVLDKRKRAA